MSKDIENKSALITAYRDLPLRIFFLIILIKSVLFIYISYNDKFSSFQFLITFLPTLGVILVLMSISLILKKNWLKIIYLLFLDLTLSLTYIIHSLYFRYFEDFASLYNLSQVHMLGPITDAIVGMIGKEILFFIDFLFMPLFIPWLKLKRPVSSLSWIKGLSFFLLLGLLFNIPSIMFNSMLGNYFKSVPERKRFVRLWGIVTYQTFDAYNYLKAKVERSYINQADVELVTNWFDKNHEESYENNVTGIWQNLNLIIIQVESLQNFIIGFQWNGAEVSPNLNKLAKSGIYFNQLFDQTWAGNTSDATFIANCSLYPSRNGAVSFLHAQNSFNCLPKILKKKDYATATMHAYKSTYWNRAVFEKSLGFERQYYQDKYLMNDHIGWGLSDREFFSQSAAKIKDLPSPFYAFLATLTTHVPFDDITTKIDNFNLGNLEGNLIANYLRSMHYVDSAIGEFLQKLSDFNLISNTIIVVYGDHRARFEENDLKMVGIYNMDELRKIPLIIKLPGKNLGYKINTIGGLIDFAPTISNILGINRSDTFFMGRNLFNTIQSFVIFRDGSFVNGDKHIDNDYVQKQLSISDLIVEKDLLRFINKQEKD